MERKTGPVRAGDPSTSYAAAADVGPSISTVRARVLLLLRMRPAGLTHDQLIALYRTRGWPPASDSSIRTRCNELWKDGDVERLKDSAAGRSRFGRRSLRWRAVSVQNSETAGPESADGGPE
jgi:hypothetical protein